MTATAILGPALIGFFGAILGGLIQAVFTSFRERRNFRWATNRDNYGLFLQAIAGMAKNPPGSPEREKYVQMNIEAIAKVLLQGSPAVVRALQVYQRHKIFSTEESFHDFARLTEAMREDIGGKPVPGFVPMVRSILFEEKPSE